MFANLTKLGQSAAQKAAKLAESVGQLSKIQAEYDIAAEVGYAGPGGIWKIHRARRKRYNDGVCSVAVNVIQNVYEIGPVDETSSQNSASPTTWLLSRHLSLQHTIDVCRITQGCIGVDSE